MLEGQHHVSEENAAPESAAWLQHLTFLPHLHILANGHMFPPRLLDDPSVAIKLPLPHFLQQEQLQRQQASCQRNSGN